MKKLIVVLLMMFSMILVANANAASDDWITVDQNNEATFKINVASIVDSNKNGRYVNFTSVYDFKKLNGVTVDKKMKNYTHLISEYTINCDSKQFVLMKALLYKGTTIVSINGKDNTSYVIEDNTFMGTAYNYLCTVYTTNENQ